MNVASALLLRDGDRSRLLTRMSTGPAGLVQRARILLLAAQGLSNPEVAERLGTSRPTVLKWRGRYEVSGIESLGDLPRPGRPGTVDEVAVLAPHRAVSRVCAGARGAGSAILEPCVPPA